MITNSVSEQCEGTEAMDIRATDNVKTATPNMIMKENWQFMSPLN